MSIHSLDVTNLSFSYQDGRGKVTPVIDRVSFRMKHGERLAILGRSGTGKTTLCRIIAGLLAAATGKVLLDGQEVLGPSSRIAITFQDSPCFPWLTVLQNVAFADRSRDAARIDKLIADLGLSDARDKYPRDLSGGMRQRVAIGRALAVSPACLILDEPFSALDLVTKASLQKLLEQTELDRGFLCIMVLHSIEDAMASATRILVMGGKPAKILDDFPITREDRYETIKQRVVALLNDSG